MFMNFKELVWGVSTRADRPMKLLDGGESRENRVNRESYFKRKSINSLDIISADISHGINIRLVAAKDKGQLITNTDGLLTNDKDVVLSVTIADCLPIFIFDPAKKAIGLMHAGWRGLAKGIGAQIILRMKEEFNSRPENLDIYLGPHLKSCHFEIKEDLRKIFKDYPEAIRRNEEKYFLDMEKVLVKQLKTSGGLENNIESSPECTYCQASKYFSYRREKITPPEAQIAYLGLK